MDKGTDARNLLLGKVVPLRLGYVGVVNRCQEVKMWSCAYMSYTFVLLSYSMPTLPSLFIILLLFVLAYLDSNDIMSVLGMDYFVALHSHNVKTLFGLYLLTKQDILLNRSVKEALSAEEKFFRSRPVYLLASVS